MLLYVVGCGTGREKVECCVGRDSVGCRAKDRSKFYQVLIFYCCVSRCSRLVESTCSYFTFCISSQVEIPGMRRAGFGEVGSRRMSVLAMVGYNSVGCSCTSSHRWLPAASFSIRPLAWLLELNFLAWLLELAFSGCAVGCVFSGLVSYVELNKQYAWQWA